MGRFDEALELIESVCATAEKELGKDHLDTMMHLDKHAGILVWAADKPDGIDEELLKQAIPIYERVIETRTAKLGPFHPLVREATNNWILCRMGTGEEIPAEEMQALKEAMQKQPSSDQ